MRYVSVIENMNLRKCALEYAEVRAYVRVRDGTEGYLISCTNKTQINELIDFPNQDYLLVLCPTLPQSLRCSHGNYQ